MDFSFFLPPDEWIRAIGMTLIYSLGQGLLLAMVAGSLVIATRRSDPSLRYKLLVGSLFIFCVSVIVTFVAQLVWEKSIYNAGPQISAIFLPSNPGSVGGNGVMTIIEAHSGTIVIIWLIMVMARTFSLLRGLRELHQLRSTGVVLVDVKTQHYVKTLAAKMGVNRYVQLAESALVKVPMIVGHLKPLILIPAGMLMALPPAAIEAILLHELAHVSRRDYLVNLIISLIETVFFFNPAVLWVVMLIKEEREHCCDNLVLAQTDNKIEYIKALVSCQEYHLTANYAMPLNGHKNHLLSRVKRMLSERGQPLNRKERSLLSFAVVLAIAVVLIFSGKQNNAVGQVAHIPPDKTVKQAQGMKQYTQVEMHEDKMALPVAGDENAFKTKSEKAAGEFITAEQEIAPSGQQDSSFSVSVTQQITSMKAEGQPDHENQHQDDLKKLNSLESIKGGLRKLNTLKSEDHLSYQRTHRTDSTVTLTRAYPARKTGYEVQVPVAVAVPINMKTNTNVDLSAQLAAAMLKDSLVSMVKSYKLSETELIVNGKRISPDAFRSFKDKNLISFQKGSTIYYNYDISTVIN